MPVTGRLVLRHRGLITTMRRGAWLIVALGALLSVVLGACSGPSGGAAARHGGVQVTVINSNRSDVLIDGCGPCKPARLEGCRNPACGKPIAGAPSGNLFGWTERRHLPVRYRMVLLSSGRKLRCPAATARRPHWLVQSRYAVVYNVTVNGRCLVSHSPVTP